MRSESEPVDRPCLRPRPRGIVVRALERRAADRLSSVWLELERVVEPAIGSREMADRGVHMCPSDLGILCLAALSVRPVGHRDRHAGVGGESPGRAVAYW